MGILDRASPMVTKVLVAFLLACLFAVFVAMCVVTPKDPVTGVGQEAELEAINSGDTAWILVSSALVLLMTPGVAFFYGGLAQHKNFVSTIMQAFIPLAIVPILWSLIGFGLAFGESPPFSNGVIGDPSKLGGLMFGVGAAPLSDLAATIPMTVFFVYQLMFAVITPALIIGAIADRVNPSALCIFISLWHIIVYCPMAHMVWHPTGLIRQLGVLDFAGGLVVHITSGYAAPLAAVYLGRSKRNSGAHGGEPLQRMFSSSEDFKEPANVPIVMLGTALLWFGWMGFNAGSAGSAGAVAGQAFLNTNSAAASSMLTFMLLDTLRGHKMRATGACIGAVIGLVTITPAAGYINIGAAFVFGMVGSAVCAGSMVVMERWGSRYVSDTLDVFACHGVGGTVGMILTSLLSTTSVNAASVDGAYYGHWSELGKALLVLVCAVAYVFAATWAILWFTDKLIALRVSDIEFIEGLDKSKHGERAMAVTALIKELEQVNSGTGGNCGLSPRSQAASPVRVRVAAVPSIMGGDEGLIGA